MQLSTSHMPSGLPSPTLTNPDMILPYDSPSPDSSPPTPRRVQRMSSSPPIDDADSTHSNDSGPNHMKDALRNLFRNGERSKLQKARKKEDASPVTEKRSRDNRSPPSGTNGTSMLASSPILHDGYAIPTAGIAMLDGDGECQWRNFSGIADGKATSQYSEESHESVLDLGRPNYDFPPLDNEKNGFSAPPDVEDDDPYSHAAMSIRAEQILANAKKRLTNMEGNLSRARSTLHRRPSSSMSSFKNHSPEAVSLYTLPKGNTPPSKHRQANTPPSAGNNKRHVRVFSETSVPSTLNTPSSHRPENGGQAPRSSSALGSTSPEQSEDQSSENSRNWFWTGLTRSTSHAHRHNYSLPALDEDGPAPASFEPSVLNGRLSEENEQQSMEPDLATKSSDFDVQNPPAQGLTRARSTTQMRDLRDQMQDLKGKISSLKKKAREDSMQRRSLQSLRTPSPFTAAEQWYSDASSFQAQAAPKIDSETTDFTDEMNGLIEEEGGLPASEKSEMRISPDAENKSDESGFGNNQHNNTTLQVDGKPVERLADRSTSDSDVARAPSATVDTGYQNEDKPQGYGTDGEDSLYGDHDYHETSPSPIGERHEDRPDAFDYEHFFLHSGTGTVARKDLSPSSSRSSIYSVETTKPSNENAQSTTATSEEGSTTEGTPKREPSSQQKGHSRNGSVESISTVATFATATEGKGSDGEASEDEWLLHHPIAGSWQPDHKRKLARSDIPTTDLSRTGSGKRHATAKTMASTNADPVPAVPSPYLAERSAPSSQSPDLLALLGIALPPNDNGSTHSLQLSEGDKTLVEKLIKSLSKVCARLQTTEAESSRYDGRVWRRRLDAARRVLDGEMNGEPF